MCVLARIAELQRGRNDAAVLLVVAPERGFDSHLTKWYTLTTCTAMDPALSLSSPRYDTSGEKESKALGERLFHRNSNGRFCVSKFEKRSR